MISAALLAWPIAACKRNGGCHCGMQAKADGSENDLGQETWRWNLESTVRE